MSAKTIVESLLVLLAPTACVAIVPSLALLNANDGNGGDIGRPNAAAGGGASGGKAASSGER